jgi:ribosomal protein L11 methyltransferase
MSDFVCFHCKWKEIFTEDGTTLDAALMGERAEIITAFLGEFPFTHFESEMGWVKAFADENDIGPADYSVVEASVEDFIDSFAWSVVKRENWNEMWEKNFFEPLLVGDFFVRAPFHPAAPAGRRTITIEPRMSFGTGHHGTTRLMLTALQEMDGRLENARVLDMGTGTGILAIAAEMLGASEVLGIEIDDWVVDNANDNLKINQTKRTKIILGDAKTLDPITNGYYHVVLANIHREVLLADMPEYKRVLQVDGNLLLSGLKEEDVPLISEKAQSLNLVLQQTQMIEGWVMMKFENK